ncbi:hypothetical protein RJ641_004396 [Dillenia turbinata]|uniref:BHLH domain-containing protein n=1 Tax=Dillenia turbinata TaxID=194707 RepID=A0AAN8ZA23_9MAGN
MKGSQNLYVGILAFAAKVKVMILKNKEMCRSSNGADKRRVKGKHIIKCASMTRRRMLMKRRGSRGSSNDIGILKKLVPNGESMGLNGLFQETADYIKSLQMRVKIMQFMKVEFGILVQILVSKVALIIACNCSNSSLALFKPPRQDSWLGFSRLAKTNNSDTKLGTKLFLSEQNKARAQIDLATLGRA